MPRKDNIYVIRDNYRYNTKVGLNVFEEDLDHPELNNGVLNLSNTKGCGPYLVEQLTHLTNVRSTMPNGWGYNVFKNIQVLDLSYNNLIAPQLDPLFNALYYQEVKLKVLNLSNNDLMYVGGILDGVGSYTRPGDGTKQIHNVERWILSNNLLDDSCAKNISDHLHAGYLKGTKHIDVSGNNITDVGLGYFASALTHENTKNLKLLDISGNDISLPKIDQFLNQISQEIFLITEKAHDNGQNGQAVFKDSGSGSLYDMVIKSDGKDATIEFADGTTGISGVSAGDTCPPSVKSQISTCIGAGVGGVTGTWTHCSSAGDMKAQLVCRGGAFITGCATGVATLATTQCVSGSEYEGRESGGWDVDATPLSGVTHSTDIDWDHWGDLGTMGFNS